MAAGEGVDAVERSARRHYGVLEIVQTAIGGLLLMVASIAYYAIRDLSTAVQGQAVDIGVTKSQVQALSNTVQLNQTRVDAQIAALTNISATLIRLDTKQLEDERRLEELQKTQKMK